MAGPDPRFVGLSCYTSNLAGYLAGEFPDTPRWFAESVRVAVRTDLPDQQLALSHHRFPLDRLPDGTRLTYATAPVGAVLDAVDAELRRHGRVVVVTDNAALPWSPARGDGAAPHWLLVDHRRGDGWHVVDGFAGLLPGGAQQPYAGWLGGADLVAAMTPPDRWSPEQQRRNALAFGHWLPPPAGSHPCWLARTAGPGADPELPGEWLLADDDALVFLREHVAGSPADAVRHLDDLWTVAQHRTFRYRWSGDGEAAAAWAELPRALRFAVDSARRGRPRPGLVRATFDRLRQLDCDRSIPSQPPAAAHPHRQSM
ncbi:hypothetical protein C1I99_02205 [Micromonospora deserti]|uniref:Butirosin biosynthesis protein H N-terminal domain-containing protein n=2 Tax=Micromonospora deserti TaxID=2070366 RepID=A0A2W2CST0_9ACTN|nr:hypothetical protein C1I99_02205 [Micromonospora deserti]